MRYVRRRPRAREPESLGRTVAVRRDHAGRECCLNNPAGRAEYQRRKQLLWEEQGGLCALETCRQRMSLAGCRMTGGSWQATGQTRDDRLQDREGRKINELVCKDCLRGWHEARHEAEAAA